MSKIFQGRLFGGEPKEVGFKPDKPAVPEVPPAAQPAEPKDVNGVNWDLAAHTKGGIRVSPTIRITGSGRVEE